MRYVTPRNASLFTSQSLAIRLSEKQAKQNKYLSSIMEIGQHSGIDAIHDLRITTVSDVSLRQVSAIKS